MRYRNALHKRLFWTQKLFVIAWIILTGNGVSTEKEEISPSHPGNEFSGMGKGSIAQILVQSPLSGKSVDNVFNEVDFLAHALIMQNVSRLGVVRYGAYWTLEDICVKPELPKLEGDAIELIVSFLNEILPCVIITPLNCFWEGSFALGPESPIDVSLLGVTDARVDWSNLDPSKLLEKANELLYDLTGLDSVQGIDELTELLERNGMKHGYQRRQCLDPYAENCPKTSPNYRDSTKSVPINNLVKKGCRGAWPTDLIRLQNDTDTFQNSQMIQTVIWIADKDTIYKRFVDFPKHKMYSNVEWTPEKASEIIDAWQRNFGDMVRLSALNREVGLRKLFQDAYSSRDAFVSPLPAPQLIFPSDFGEDLDKESQQEGALHPVFSTHSGKSESGNYNLTV